MSMFKGNRRVQISNVDQAKSLIKRFGSETEIGACVKSKWGDSLTVTIYIEHGIVVGWDHNQGNSYLYTWSDYDELMAMTEPTNSQICEDCGCSVQTPYNDEIMACSDCGQLKGKTQLTEQSPSKEDTMTGTSFETKHFINERNVNDMSVDQFLHAITAKKDQIGNLESIDIKSDVLIAQIAAQNADLALIIEKMEELHG